jgi:putative oxidoreductase
LQRLFTTFPNGWPGTGLLLLRLTAGLSMVIRGMSEAQVLAPLVAQILACTGVVGGILILIGLWTPVAASAATLLELWIVFSRTGLSETAILPAALTASLAMLGPGAWSIDAGLYGRRRVVFPD